MRNRLWSSVALLVSLVAIAVFLFIHKEGWREIQRVSLANLVLLLMLQLGSLVVNGIFLKIFAAKFGLVLGFREWFGLSVVTTMGNYLTPFSGGLFARAAYLKRKYAFSYASFVSVMAANYLIVFFNCGLLGVWISALLARRIHSFRLEIPLFFGSVSCTAILLALMPNVKLKTSNRWSRALSKVWEGWNIVRTDFLLLLKLSVLTLVNLVLAAASLFVAYRALELPIDFLSALLIGLFASLSILLRVTPGNLGIQEAVISLTSALLGAGLEEGFLGAMLVRAASLVVVFILGPVFSYLLAQDV